MSYLLYSCCDSGIAASNYLKGITHGGANMDPTRIQQFSDFQQGAVQQLILPFGKRLTDSEEADGGRMKELPYCLYDSASTLVTDIVKTGKKSIKKGLAVIGGIQINTAPEMDDYFHVLKFDYYDENGELVGSLMDKIQ